MQELNTRLEKNIYFGIGLCSKTELTSGLPFDILDLILTSEQLRRLGGGAVFVHLADTHAKTNGFKIKEVDSVAQYVAGLLRTIFVGLRLSQHQVIMSSSVDTTNAYKSILESIDGKNEYIRRELTDILWYEKNKKVHLKMGWALTKNYIDGILDERYFDNLACSMGSLLSFHYVNSGRTLDPKRPKACPYFVSDVAHRIILSQEENPQEKIKQCHHAATKKSFIEYAERICSLYEKLVEALPTDLPVESKIQLLIKKIFQPNNKEGSDDSSKTKRSNATLGSTAKSH